MIFHWEQVVSLAALREECTDRPFSLSGEGLWICLVSSGECGVLFRPEGGSAALTAAPPPRIQAGMLLLSPGRLELRPVGECHVLAALLTGTAPTQLLAGLPALPFPARGETCPAAAELLGSLAQEEPKSRLCSQLCFDLLCELAEADSAAPPLPPLVAEAIAQIRENYAGLYGVEELSERLGVSKSHLVRTFTAAVGTSPGKYLTQVRIEAAMRLLRHREYSLEVIASLCGFSGANYLCRVFKRETGQSPAQWRALSGQSRALSPVESLRELELFV